MAGIKTIPESATLSTTRAHFLYTFIRIRRHPLTAALIAEAENFHSRIEDAIAEERILMEADLEAGAAVQFADRDLDDSVDFVASNVDRGTLFGTRLFGDLRPSELKRPTLGNQLSTMSSWPDVLASDEASTLLKDHAATAQQRIQTATNASNEKRNASQKLMDFRTIGTRAKLNRDFNVLRKAWYAKLGEIEVTHRLGAGFAESFFLEESKEELTLNELERKIGALEGDLVGLKKQRDAMIEEQAKRAEERARAERVEKEAKLEALQQQKAKIAAEEAALLAELGQK